MASNRDSKVRQLRKNDQIRVREVRLVGSDGAQIGVVPIQEALEAADEAGLDLVEISPMASPPVCRLMDYGKYLFEERKKQAQAKKKQKGIQVKEVKFRPVTDTGDYNIKIRQSLGFLEEGNRVKITIRFRGREMAHQEQGVALFRRIEAALAASGKVMSDPAMEGRQLVAMFSPEKGGRVEKKSSEVGTLEE